MPCCVRMCLLPLLMQCDLSYRMNYDVCACRFERDDVVTGPPYAGEDRHNGEIVAFHLSRQVSRFIVAYISTYKVVCDSDCSLVSPSVSRVCGRHFVCLSRCPGDGSFMWTVPPE